MCLQKKKVTTTAATSKKKRCCTCSGGCCRLSLVLLGLLALAVGVIGVGKFAFAAAYLTQDYGIIAFLAGVALLVLAFLHFICDTRSSASVGATKRALEDPRAAAALLELAKMATVSKQQLAALEFKSDLEKLHSFPLHVGAILAEFDAVVDEYGARVAGWPAEGAERCALRRAGVLVGDRVFSLGEKTLWRDLMVEIVRELKAVHKITPVYVVRAIPEAELKEMREAAKAARKAGASKDLGQDLARTLVVKGSAEQPVMRKAANVLAVRVRLDLPGGAAPITSEAKKASDVQPALYEPP